MNKYVELDTLSKAFEEADCDVCQGYADECGKWGFIRDTVANIVKALPAINPVHRGHWVEKPFLLGTSHFCSVCGENYGMPHKVYNFCPNCGAKMDGDAEMDEDLTISELAAEYLGICEDDCCGDISVGFPHCPFYAFPDIDAVGSPTSGGCRLQAYRRKPKGGTKL